MGSDQASSRLDTLQIRSHIFREIGHQRAESYFEQLGRFFASKITKSEFDKFCIKTIGRQNIPLHNRLIRSIIKNASVAKSPPLRNQKKGGSFVRFGNGKPKNNQIQPLSPSTRKCRSRKLRDRPSPLGPLGKPQSLTTTESMSKAQSATEMLSLGSRPPVEVASVEEGEEVEQIAAGSPSVQSRSPVTAPLGVSMNLRGGFNRKSVSSVSSINRETCQSSGELPDTRTLRNRLERRLEMEGLKISMDSVSLLNSGLDAFVRRLIEPCLSLANTRCGNERVREMNLQYAHQRRRRVSCVSISDFRAGVELNPQILGEDWPILLEKICSRGLDE
uniref:Transcriptional regulator of RNA polII, SAGA, subunit n=1 Tax=Noccaea caerulescens TaxID=107243 RepID=A0A1J3GAA8_NOCCA